MFFVKITGNLKQTDFLHQFEKKTVNSLRHSHLEQKVLLRIVELYMTIHTYTIPY